MKLFGVLSVIQSSTLLGPKVPMMSMIKIILDQLSTVRQESFETKAQNSTGVPSESHAVFVKSVV